MERELRTVRPIYPLDRPSNLVSPQDGLRTDGRKLDQFRNIFMKTGVISAARGSAYLELNKTKIICGVYGPRQIAGEFSDKGRLNCDFKMTSFSADHRRSKNPSTRQQDQEYSIAMRQALEVCVCLDKYPKSSLDVYAIVLEADGGVLSAAINCASLALADAGVEMFDLVASSSACEVENHLVVDPTHIEEKYSTSSIICSFMPSLNEITHTVQSGDMKHTSVVESIELCLDGCAKIHALMKQTLLKSAEKRFSKKQQTQQQQQQQHQQQQQKA